MFKKEEMEQIFRSHYGAMYRLARGILHDDEESKDVVSEVFARLLDSDLQPAAGKIQQYLLTGVRNRCCDIISHRCVQERMRRLYPMDISACSSPVGENEERLQAILRYAGTSLAPQCYRVFRMRFEAGMQYKEIAGELGISIPAVYKHLSQALRKIRLQFKNYGYDY